MLVVCLIVFLLMRSVFFFFTYPPTTEIYTLSLHDALPICRAGRRSGAARPAIARQPGAGRPDRRSARGSPAPRRSEEHTSELQSLRHLVCRLLLEKKNKKNTKNKTSPTEIRS